MATTRLLPVLLNKTQKNSFLSTYLSNNMPRTELGPRSPPFNDERSGSRKAVKLSKKNYCYRASCYWVAMFTRSAFPAAPKSTAPAKDTDTDTDTATEIHLYLHMSKQTIQLIVVERNMSHWGYGWLISERSWGATTFSVVYWFTSRPAIASWMQVVYILHYTLTHMFMVASSSSIKWRDWNWNRLIAVALWFFGVSKRHSKYDWSFIYLVSPIGS